MFSFRVIALAAGAGIGLAAAACGGTSEAPRTTASFAPLHPDAAPMSAAAFAAATQDIVEELDAGIAQARRILDVATSIGDYQARFGQLLPMILPLFERALEQVAALPPPAAWRHDHARFVVEQRELLRARFRLFGGLAVNRLDLAAQAAAEIERRFAILQEALEPEFLTTVSAFFDRRRYGALPGG